MTDRARPGRATLALLLAATAIGAGCGDEADRSVDTTPPPPAGARISEDARVEGAEGQRIAEEAVRLMDAENGDEACYEIVASDYVESLGGLKACAEEFEPIATGPLDTVVAARMNPDEKTGVAELESEDGSERQTVKYARTVADAWRIDGLGD